MFRVIFSGLVVLVLLAGCTVDVSHDAEPAAGTAKTAADADKFVQDVNEESLELGQRQARLEWVKATYITPDTEALAAEGNEDVLAFNSRIIEKSKDYDGLDLQGATARAIKLIKLGSSLPAPDDADKREELAAIAARMESVYGKGKYCPKGDDSCLSEVDLIGVMARSRDYDTLLDAWSGWRTISPPMRDDYTRFVELINEGASALGFANAGALWRSGYDMSADEFEAEAERLWLQVKPLYEDLHCYVRDKLAEEYGEDKVPQGEPIPAHLLGNMWSQQWGNIYDLVEPYSGVGNLDVTGALVEQDYDAMRMVELSEEFFTSLSLPELPETFWERSMLTKPSDRDVVCHASAWPMDGQDDVRIKMCIQPNEDDLTTIYHELGHVYYFLAQKDQPRLFQNGAHDGFHEAIGDTITLAMTPEYMQGIGLVSEFERDQRATINQQMKMALEKIAFLPFSKLVDQWRWDVFAGRVKPGEYNEAWWKLRTRYQGIVPPVERDEDNFDPGAKYHVPANVPYTRYFLSHIMQFQFYKAMCDLAGHEGPLDQCSFYGSEEAGKRLEEMLAMGNSQPWPDALEKLTGTREMDASAIIDYFQPLIGWLEEQNEGKTCGW
ncbi:MAG: M2 family metallopeptidase [Gammaproteobacteria bacterium]|nr:M2 family metallopeptidase [Gammaproteobacteria bacterium]